MSHVDDDPENEEDARLRREEQIEEAQREAREASRKRRFALLKKIAKRLRILNRNFEGRKDEEWDAIVRTKSAHLTLFSSFGVFCVIFYAGWVKYKACEVPAIGTNISSPCVLPMPGHYGYPDAGFVTRKLNFDNVWSGGLDFWVMVLTQSLLTFSTLVCVVLIAQFYKLQLAEKRREWSGITELDLVEAAGTDQAVKLRQAYETSYNFWQSSLKYTMGAEIALHILHPFAYRVETYSAGTNTLYQILQIAVFGRFYLLLRHLYISSSIYQFRHDIVLSNKELKRNGFRVTALATAKIIFYDYPIIVAGVLFFAPISVFAFFMYVIEGDTPGFFEIFDCFWFTFVTSTTIGYGDVTAVTTTGRVVVMLLAFTTFFTVATIGGVTTNLLTPSREQKTVGLYLQRLQSQTEYQRAAVHMITVAYLERKKRRLLGANVNPRMQRSFEMYAAVKRLRHARLEARESLGSAADPVVEQKLVRSLLKCYFLYQLLEEQLRHLGLLEERILTDSEQVKLKIAEKSDRTYGALSSAYTSKMGGGEWR